MPIKQRRLSTLFQGLVFSGLLAVSAFGQAQPGQPDKKCLQQETGFRFGPPPREANGMPPYLRGLKLTEQQEDKIFAVVQAQASAQYQKSKVLRAAYQGLQTLAQGGEISPASARAAADKVGQALADVTFLRLQTDSQIRSVLTPEQRDVLSKRPLQGPNEQHGGFHEIEGPMPGLDRP